MGYSTSLVFFYGVEETDEIRKKCRVKTVTKSVLACSMQTCVKGDRCACEKCGNSLRLNDKFCGNCGTDRKIDGPYCRFCGQKKVTGPKQVTTTLRPCEAYEKVDPDGFDGENHLIASMPCDTGIYIGRKLGSSYNCRDKGGQGFEIPAVDDDTRNEVNLLLYDLGIADVPRLFAILQVV